MSSDRQLGQRIASLPTVLVDGRYYRFTTRRRIKTAFNGSNHGGRWGPPGAFRVLYLADDYESCVIEAYRHATDPGVDPEPPPVNLGLLTCDVSVTHILDLRSATARHQVGLEPAILFSEPQGPDGEVYRACSLVAQVAHQLNRHGLIVPAATHRGHTLALFTDLLPHEEVPTPTGGVATWTQLPADPRRLRLITSES